MAEDDGAGGPPDTRRPGYWLPLAVGGLLLAGAVALYAWTNTWVGPVRGTSTGPHAGIWIGYGPLTHTPYFPPPTSWYMSGNELLLPSFYYLGWYWAVALAAGAVLWFYRDSRSGTRRAYLATAVVLVALALALPLLTQALPWLASVWLRGPWVKGLPALLIAGCGLGIAAWAEHSRRLARLTVIYVVALAIGGWLASVPDYELMFWPALTPQPWHLTPLDALLGPAAVLIAAGMAFRWRGRRPGRGRLPA